VISNAVWGLNLLQSQVDISTIKVEGLEERNKIAFRVMERSTVNCIDCGFDGHSCGIFVGQSSLIVDGVTISRPRCVGMVVDGASVDGDSLLLSNIPKYGLMTLGKDASVTLNSFEVQAAPNVELNFPVYATAGRIEFKKGVMADCACGIFVDPRREFMDEAELSERLGLKDRIGIAVKSEGSLKPVEIVSHQLTLKNCKRVWVFNGTGSSQIKQLKSDLIGDKLTPKLLNTRENEHVLTQHGTDLTNFEVTEAKKKE